jgi:hypothetical protein
MKLARALSICLLLVATAAFAGAYEDGVAAYDRGDYAGSLASWLPLAGHGHRTAAFNVAVLSTRVSARSTSASRRASKRTA